MVCTRIRQAISGLFLFFLFLAAPPVHAQDSTQIRFTHFTTEDGLGENWIRGGIVQDHHGFLWIATNDGLNRYDGYQFRLFQHNPNLPNSLSHNSIRAIAIDAKGHLWLATGGGLNQFDPTTESFTYYQHKPNDPTGLSDNDLRELLIARDGIIWAGTANGGLNRFDPSTETFTHYLHDANNPTGLGSNRVSALFEDASGQLWVGTHQGGLQRFDPSNETFNSYRHNAADATTLSDNTVSTIFADADGALWVGTAGGGLNQFDRTTESFTRFSYAPADVTSLSGNNIQTIAPVDAEPGMLWIGTDTGGLNKFDTITGTTTRYQHAPHIATTLSDNDVITIFTDRSGVVWVGTRNGLNQIVPYSQQFPYYSQRSTITNTLSNDLVQAIYQDEAGIVWLGTAAGGLNRFDPTTSVYTHYRHRPDDPNTPLSDDVEVIEAGASGILWLGYGGDGLSKFELASQTFTHYLPDEENPTSIPTGAAQRSISYDPAGAGLWVALDGGGLVRFDPATETFTAYRHQPNDPNSLSSDRVKLVYQDRAGLIWVGTVDPILHKLDPATGSITRYPYVTDEADFRINTLYETSSGIFWVGTRSGLLKFNPATGEFFADDETALWEGKAISKMSADRTGAYWFGTESALIRYNPQTKFHTSFDRRDGFISCCRGWFLNRQSGALLTSGSNERGFHLFYIDRLQPRTYLPPLLLTRFELFGRLVPISSKSPLQQAIFATSNLTLAYNDNFAFEFAALDFAGPETVQYQYRLDGFEDNWNLVGPKRRYAAYTSLPAGAYTFRVRATDSRGHWSVQEVALPLTITPPWWGTLWFRAGVLLGAVLLLSGGYRWRIWQIKQRNRLLKQQVAERTHTLQQRTQELAESEMRFRGLAMSTFEAVIIHDQGRILEANRAATELLGYSRAELVGQQINRFITPDSDQLAAQKVDADSEEPYEIEGITKDGAIIPLEVRAKSVPFQGQQVRVAAARDLTERRQIEAHKERLAAMEERERIGRDLHDDLGQVMGYLSVQAQTTWEFLRQEQISKARAALAQLMQVANEAHGDVRQYILGVRAVTPSITNFFEELTRYTAHLHNQYGLDVHISWPDDTLTDSPLSPEVETQLLRIIQEALTNVRKHAEVSSAQLLFTLHPDTVQVVISDEGKGFDHRTGTGNMATSSAPSFGLEIMRERAESVDGSLNVRSKAGHGTQIIVQLPAMLDSPPEQGVRGLRVLLVDDHPLYVEGLRTLLSARGVQVVGVANDGLGAQQLARQLLPDLILMDVEMPHCNGLEATRRIKTELPDIKIVMLTVAADDSTLFEALKQGASGYLLKSLEGRQFFTLLTQVMRGEIVLSPTLAAKVLSTFAQQTPDPAPIAPELPVLTNRQREVLELVAQRASNREIADRLHVTERTVKFHVGQILERLQLRSRYELAHYAQQQGLIPPVENASSN